jgi:hypothetical protein
MELRYKNKPHLRVNYLLQIDETEDGLRVKNAPDQFIGVKSERAMPYAYPFAVGRIS